MAPTTAIQSRQVGSPTSQRLRLAASSDLSVRASRSPASTSRSRIRVFPVAKSCGASRRSLSSSAMALLLKQPGQKGLEL